MFSRSSGSNELRSFRKQLKSMAEHSGMHVQHHRRADKQSNKLNEYVTCTYGDYIGEFPRIVGPNVVP